MLCLISYLASIHFLSAIFFNGAKTCGYFSKMVTFCPVGKTPLAVGKALQRERRTQSSDKIIGVIHKHSSHDHVVRRIGILNS